MTKTTESIRELDGHEIELVTGAGRPDPVQQVGYGPNRLNISPFGLSTPFDLTWALVGVNGHL